MKHQSTQAASKIIISVIIGMAVGFVLRGPQLTTMVIPGQNSSRGLPVSSVECVCDVQRVRDIETALRVERETNQLLVAEIDGLQTKIDRLVSASQQEGAGEETVADQVPVQR